MSILQDKRERWLACAAILGIVWAGCNDTQAPPAGGDGAFQGHFDASGLDLRLETPEGQVSPLRLVVTQIDLDASTKEVHAWVALRNESRQTLRGPEGVFVGGFVPADVRPVNAEELACPAVLDSRCLPWLFDHRGTYGIEDQLAPGETSQPVEWILLDPSGESFAFRARVHEGAPPQSGVIAGSVFRDHNGNGRRDSTESGIAGAAIVLRHGDRAETRRTDARGRYEFVATEAGAYELGFDAGDGCDPTTPAELHVVLVRRPDGTLSSFLHGDFGCRGEDPNNGPIVSGLVFEDLNRNGLPDDGERGIPGVVIVGSAPHCPTFAPIQTRTNERGLYRLQLPPCVPPFMLHRQPVRGYVDTSPNPVVFEQPIPPQARADFGLTVADSSQDFAVEGIVFEDHDADGVQDSNEPGIAGARLTLSGLQCSTPVAAQAHTDERGRYRFEPGVAPCPMPWLVQRHGPGRDTLSNPRLVPRPPPDGSRTARADFGVVPSVVPPPAPSLQGSVFLDANRNGVRDRGEAGVPGAELSLLSPCEVLRVTRTDVHGNYAFPASVVAVCPVTGVQQTQPVFRVRTTPNPVHFPPGSLPLPVVDFGVVADSNTP